MMAIPERHPGTTPPALASSDGGREPTRRASMLDSELGSPKMLFDALLAALMPGVEADPTPPPRPSPKDRYRSDYFLAHAGKLGGGVGWTARFFAAVLPSHLNLFLHVLSFYPLPHVTMMPVSPPTPTLKTETVRASIEAIERVAKVDDIGGDLRQIAQVLRNAYQNVYDDAGELARVGRVAAALRGQREKARATALALRRALEVRPHPSSSLSPTAITLHAEQ